MSPGRVIQNSDDEEDALSDVATSVDPLQEQEQEQQSGSRYGDSVAEHGELPPDDEIRPTEPVVTGSQLGVNFDDFLQSQPHGMGLPELSSSQQRREERWIPAESRSESVGTMVNEINRAQRRLVDDATPFDYPRLPSTDPLADPMLSTYQSSSGVNGVKRTQPMADIADGEDHDTGYPSEQQAKRSKISEDYSGGDESVKLPQDDYEDGLQDLPQHATAIDEQPHGHPGPYNSGERVITNDNEASVVTSYNFFDSSLKLREYTEVSTMPIATTAEERGELVDTIRRTPGRSKSMQVPLDSPHDTEPFSSIISPQIKRAKSDVLVKGISPRPSIDAPDELSLPVTVEAPVMQKTKRGRKRKQVVEDGTDGEPDELNADEIYTMPLEPKKRGRGRPRKVQVEGIESPKPQYDDNVVMAVPQENIADPDRANKTEDVKFIPRKDEPDHDTFNQTEADVGLPKEQYLPRPSRSRAQPIENYESPDSILCFPKETKKRKIKRGKTTSIIIKKSYESDVEDDVIWIDEKPADVTFKTKEKTPAAQIPETVGVNDSEYGEGDEVKQIKPVNAIDDKQESNSLPIDLVPLQASEPPGPKKRGRKRKKTAEPVITGHPLDVQEHIPQETEANESTTLQDVTNNVVPPPTTEDDTPAPNISTPKKATTEPQPEEQTCTPKTTRTKGPDKHSPITSTSKIPFRVGLSRRARIAPLLKVVRK